MSIHMSKYISMHMSLHMSAVTIASILGTAAAPWTYDGCGCAQPGTYIDNYTNAQGGRCTSTSSGTRQLNGFRGSTFGDCFCRSNYTNVNCVDCEHGYQYDPFPFCKSGACRVEQWQAWSGCSVTCGTSPGTESRTRSITYSGAYGDCPNVRQGFAGCFYLCCSATQCCT